MQHHRTVLFWAGPAAISTCFLLTALWMNRPGNFSLVPMSAGEQVPTANSPDHQPIPIWKDESLERGVIFAHSQKSDGISGLDEALGSGACTFDFDNDGWMDLYLVGGEGHTKFYGKKSWWAQASTGRLLKNSGGRFSDVTQAAGLEFEAWGMGCGAGDLNNDGFSDLVVTTRKKNYLLKNIGGKAFEIVDLGDREDWSTSVSFADVNKDGLLDIYISNYLQYDKTAKHFEAGSGYKSTSTSQFNPAFYPGSPNQLWLNRGDWSFEEVALAFGVHNSEGRTLSHLWLDINRDSWLDLISVNDVGSTTRLFINQDGRKFVPAELSSRLSLPSGVHDVEPLDINADGELDLVFSSAMGKPPALLQGLPQPDGTTFRDVSWERIEGTAEMAAYNGWASQSVDIDNDGTLDVIFANGMARPDPDAHYVALGQTNSILLSRADGQFQSLELEAFKLRQSSRSVVTIDVENDGDQDLLITNNNGPATLLINHSPKAAWLGIDLLDKHGHHGQFRRLEFITNTRSVFRYPAHVGFLGSGDHRLLVALEDGEAIKEVKILWQDGSSTVLHSLPDNAYATIQKGRGMLASYSGGDTRVRTIPNRLAIWQIKAGASDVREALAAFEQSNIGEKLEIVDAVRRHPNPGLMAILRAGSKSSERAVQLAAIEALKHLESEYSYYWLEGLLNGSDEALICEVAEVFRHFFIEEEAMVLHKYLAIMPLIELLSNQNDQTRICAVKALAESKNVRAAAAIEELLNRTKNVELIRAAIAALGELRQKSSIQVVERHLDSLPGESKSALAKLRSNEQRHEIHFDHSSSSTLSESEHASPPEFPACPGLSADQFANLSFAKIESLFAQCPESQGIKWVRYYRPDLESHLSKWLTSQAIGPRTLRVVLAGISQSPPTGYESLLLTAFKNQSHAGLKTAILEQLQELPFTVGIEKAALSVLQDEGASRDARILAGEILIDHSPHAVLAYAGQLFELVD